MWDNFKSLTKEEARLAVRIHAEVIDKRGIRGYAYSLSWINEIGKEPFESIGYHDLRANSVYQSRIEDVTIADWKIPDFAVRSMLKRTVVQTE